MKKHAVGPPLGKPSTAPRIMLDLSRHCIQTALRRCYETRVARYFKSDAPQDVLETEIDLLQRALETLDFGALRSRWPALAGGHRVPVVFTMAGDRIAIELSNETILAPLRRGVLNLKSES